jgi:hypothetical protein
MEAAAFRGRSTAQDVKATADSLTAAVSLIDGRSAFRRRAREK